MIADLKPYPGMKDSGVPWLGEMPEHWAAMPLIAIAEQKSITGLKHRELLSVYLNKGVVKFSDIEEKRTNVTSEDISKCQAVDPGDFVLNNQQAWRGSVGVSALSGIVSPAYLVLRMSRRINGTFANFLFRQQHMVDQYLVCSKGVGTIQRNLYWPQLKRVSICLPPLSEQSVRFLDHADRRIRRYIQAKQRLIKLLEEQKQAIIHRAVTRGLDPNVRLKPSGIEWLGDVPEHWRIARLKDAAAVQTGLTLGKNYKGVKTETRPYLRVANVQVGRVDLRHMKCVDVPIVEANSATLRGGDVLMTEGGDIDKLGRGCVWQDEIPGCLHQNHIFAVRCRKDVLIPEFLVGLIASMHGRAYFQLTAKQTTNLASTNSGTLRAFQIFIPPLPEQQAILAEIASQTAGIAAAIDRAEREIALLLEYRTRLIADVVTGKLDVREAAAKLPNETEEPKALDADEALVDAEEDMDNEDVDAVSEEAEA